MEEIFLRPIGVCFSLCVCVCVCACVREMNTWFLLI